MTIPPVVSRRLEDKFVERASTVLLRGILGARSRFASSLRCSMGLPLGLQAREQPKSCASQTFAFRRRAGDIYITLMRIRRHPSRIHMRCSAH